MGAGAVGPRQSGAAQFGDQQIDHVKALLHQKRRMLELGIKADTPPRFSLLGADQLNDLGKGGHRVEAIKSRIARAQAGKALACAQGA